MGGRAYGPARYVALLRGINVGGKNIIKMDALRGCFEQLGHGDVSTYIQSGNVLFTAAGVPARLAAQIEAALAASFGYRARIALRSERQLRAIVDNAPAGFGERPDSYRYDVIFLREPLTAAEAIAQMPVHPEVDTAHAGDGVLYVSRLISEASRSRLSRLTALDVYQHMTIRNWNTTTRLVERL